MKDYKKRPVTIPILKTVHTVQCFNVIVWAYSESLPVVIADLRSFFFALHIVAIKNPDSEYIQEVDMICSPIGCKMTVWYDVNFRGAE